jgi:hypothetical protein
MDRKRPTISLRHRCIRDQRGAALIHVGIAIFVLVGMSAFVLDFGVMWLSRRQAQNAADAGALAGAIARAFDETTDTPAADGLAYKSAYAAATINEVFNEAGGVRVTWECPDYVDEDARCVRVDVHRDGQGVAQGLSNNSNALPVYFANLFGLANQKVRATATAWVGYGNATDCVKPFAVPDFYAPPGPETYTPGSGYSLDDVGTMITLFKGPGDFESPGWYRLTDVIGDSGGGASETARAIRTCDAERRAVGDTIPQAGVEASIKDDIQALFDLDPDAEFIDGEIVNSCAENRSCEKWVWDEQGGGPNAYNRVADGNRSYSPRIMAIPVFDPLKYQTTGVIEIVNVFGFFLIEPLPNPPNFEIRGILVEMPGLLLSGGGAVPEDAAFLKVVQLIR